MKTSLYTVLCLVVRGFALSFLIGLLTTLPGVLAAASGTPDATTKLYVLVYLGVCAIGAFALWLYPGLVARLASSRAAHEPFESSVGAIDLQRIAYAVVGAWFALSAIGTLAWTVLRIAMAQRMSANYGVAPDYGWDALVAPAVTFAAGIALALGSGGLARLARSARYASPAPQPAAGGES